MDTIESELEISNISWADLVNEHIKQDGIEHSLSKSNLSKLNNSNSTCELTIEQILELEPHAIQNDLTLLEYQKKVIHDIKKILNFYIEKQTKSDDILKIDFSDMLQKIIWLKETTKCLSDRIGLPMLNHKIVNNFNIPRSSYRFCKFDFECPHNYNDKYNGCYAQHYVHNLIHADILVIEQYIISKMDDSDKISIKELNKSVKTWAHVTSHMYDELSSVNTYYKDIKKYHRSKTIKKKNINN